MLDNLTPKQRAMMYKGRDAMEQEDNQDRKPQYNDRRGREKWQASKIETNDQKEDNAGQGKDSEDKDQPQSASQRFGSQGNKRHKRERSIGMIHTTGRRIARASTIPKARYFCYN